MEKLKVQKSILLEKPIGKSKVSHSEKHYVYKPYPNWCLN